MIESFGEITLFNQFDISMLIAFSLSDSKSFDTDFVNSDEDDIKKTKVTDTPTFKINECNFRCNWINDIDLVSSTSLSIYSILNMNSLCFLKCHFIFD